MIIANRENNMENTFSKVLNISSQNLSVLPSECIDLIVTSPPYPMIEMWDSCFSSQSLDVKLALKEKQWNAAFENMHVVLDLVWKECDRILKKNGYICINIGDETRTCDGNFQLFPNHARIINYFFHKGYNILPDVHWHKQSNAPNKFMGSGMLPAGAYVTYEHEYILIFRKGGKREFKSEDLSIRRESAYFWEERNTWFSDLWDIKGTSQIIKNPKSRKRSAAYPFEIPYRLINMYSVYGDTVLDPFGGIGTTAIASAASCRNSIICDIDGDICNCAKSNIAASFINLNEIIDNRVYRHLLFIDNLSKERQEMCYENRVHHFLVKTRQEIDLTIYYLLSMSEMQEGFLFNYDILPQDYSSISIIKSPFSVT